MAKKSEATVSNTKKPVKKRTSKKIVKKKKKKLLLPLTAAVLFVLVIILTIKLVDDSGIFRADAEVNFSPNPTVYSMAFKNTYYYPTIDGLKSVNVSGKEQSMEETTAISTFMKGMKEPVFLKSEKTALVFDISGKNAVLFDESGIIAPFSFDHDIINAKMTNDGRFVFVIGDNGAKAVVKTYDSSGGEMLNWYSGNGYVVDAAISNSQDSLAVLTYEVENKASKIYFFNLNASEPFLTKTISDKISFSVSYFGSDSLIMCEDGLYYMSDKGSMEFASDFASKKVKEFRSFTNGDMIICYENQDNSTFTIEVYNKRGRRIKKYFTSEFDSISDIQNDKFLVIRKKEIISFSKGGRVLKTIPSEFEVRNAVYFKNRIAILGNDRLNIK